MAAMRVTGKKSQTQKQCLTTPKYTFLTSWLSDWDRDKGS